MKNLSIKIFAAFAILFSSWNAQAQIVDPVKWKTSLVSLPNNEAEIEFQATISPGFHLYSTSPSTDPNVYALPTELILNADKANFELIGKLTEGKYITHYDEMQGGEVNYFENSAVFKQNNNTLLSRYAICVRHVKPKRNALNLVTTFSLTCTLVTFVYSK